MSQRQRHNRAAGAEHAARFDGAGHQRAVGRGDQRGIVQVEFSLRQGRLRLFKAGFGLGDFLRAVAGAILAQLVLRGLQRRLSLVAGGARVFQIVNRDGAVLTQPQLTLVKVLRVIVRGLRLFDGGGGLGYLFRPVAGHHQVILRLSRGDIRLGLL